MMKTNLELARNLPLELSAVLFRVRIPAAVMAQFGEGQRFEVEQEASQAPVVRLMAGGIPIALAEVRECDGKLLARVVRLNPDLTPSDKWKLVAEPAAAK